MEMQIGKATNALSQVLLVLLSVKVSICTSHLKLGWMKATNLL